MTLTLCSLICMKVTKTSQGHGMWACASRALHSQLTRWPELSRSCTLLVVHAIVLVEYFNDKGIVVLSRAIAVALSTGEGTLIQLLITLQLGKRECSQTQSRYMTVIQLKSHTNQVGSFSYRNTGKCGMYYCVHTMKPEWNISSQSIVQQLQ